MKITNRNKLEVMNLIHNNRRTTLNETYCSLSQQEMAEYLCCNRRRISRIICKLTDEGYIVPRNGKVRRYALTINGKGVLKNLAQSDSYSLAVSIKNRHLKLLKTNMFVFINYKVIS